MLDKRCDRSQNASCHRNVHRGHLRIEGRARDGLRFLDREGRDLERQHRLDVAHWLDIWLGWRGREWDSHYGRSWGPLEASKRKRSTLRVITGGPDGI